MQPIKRSAHFNACHFVFVLTIIGLLFAPAARAADTILVPTAATWKYLDNGSDQGNAWRAASFNDSTWSSGPAQLGYGDGDESTAGPAPHGFPLGHVQSSSAS